MKRNILWAVGVLLPPMFVFIAIIVLWHILVQIFAIPVYLVPGPAKVCKITIGKFPELIAATSNTALGALIGFLASLIVGSIIAFAFSQSYIIQRCFYPYAIFFQTVPIVAIAPLIVIWFGHGFMSVALISFIISLFPIITNTTTGLTIIKQELLDLFAVYRASRWQILFKLRFPHAIPYLVSGAKISSGMSVIGAIIGEIFVGYGTNQKGLGALIIQSSRQLHTDFLFACILMSTVLGLCFFGAVSILGQTVLYKWYEA